MHRGRRKQSARFGHVARARTPSRVPSRGEKPMATTKALPRKARGHANACRPDPRPRSTTRRRPQGHPDGAELPSFRAAGPAFRSRSPRDRGPGDARHALSHAPSHAHLAEAGWAGVRGPARAAARGGGGELDYVGSFPAFSGPNLGRTAEPLSTTAPGARSSRRRPRLSPAHGIGLSIGSASPMAHVGRSALAPPPGFPAQRPHLAFISPSMAMR